MRNLILSRTLKWCVFFSWVFFYWMLRKSTRPRPRRNAQLHKSQRCTDPLETAIEIDWVWSSLYIHKHTVVGQTNPPTASVLVFMLPLSQIKPFFFAPVLKSSKCSNANGALKYKIKQKITAARSSFKTFFFLLNERWERQTIPTPKYRHFRAFDVS